MVSRNSGESGRERSAPVIATPPAGDNREPIDKACVAAALVGMVSIIAVEPELLLRPEHERAAGPRQEGDRSPPFSVRSVLTVRQRRASAPYPPLFRRS